MEKSNCFEESNLNILRGEAYCFIDFIYKGNNIPIVSEVPKNLTYVPCTESSGYECESRELAVGELAVCLLYTSPSPRDALLARMPSTA